MKTIIKKWYERLKFPKEYDEEFYDMLCKYELSECSAEEYGIDEKDVRKNLLMYLYFCEELSQRYKAKGISDEILTDTLSDIVIWTKTCYGLYEKVGLEEINWIINHMTMRLFKLGRLQFRMADDVLEVHIPKGESMTAERCEKSFAMSKLFFQKYFPDFEYEKYTCDSWLLDPTLKNLLDANSNIIKFQEMFDLRKTTVSDAILRYVFMRNTTRENLHEQTPVSSFAKKVYEYAMNGKEFYIGFGERVKQ